MSALPVPLGSKPPYDTTRCRAASYTIALRERTGSVTAVPAPAWPDPTYPKTGSGVLASAFCIATTNSITVDSTAGLPGPGALLLPGTAVFSDNPPAP